MAVLFLMLRISREDINLESETKLSQRHNGLWDFWLEMLISRVGGTRP